MAASESDDDIGRLFSVRPADFVGERNATVKKLKAAGQREAAAAVEKLPRPTLSVWAVNQLARQEPNLLQQLAEATAGLQAGNAGGASSYADLLAAHRDVLKALRRKAEEILNASGFRPAPDLLTRVVHDLRAGISSPEARPLIESGRLVRDLADDSAVNPFAGAPATAPPPGTQARTVDRAADRNDGTDDGQAAHTAREQERDRARQAAREKEEARAREEARAFRRRRLANLQERVATARAASERDERALEAASRALTEAERRSEHSRAALAEAVAALEAVERDAEP
jgi:hypothetical protein